MSAPGTKIAPFLKVLRADPQAWEGLRFAPADDDSAEDVHAERRVAVLTAILFDPRPTDRALLQFLLRQDIEEAEESWGVSEGIRLSTFLLAEHRCADDAWLQWHAKTANLDTHIGLDIWPVLAGGVQAVRSMATASDHPERDELLSYLADEPYADAADDDVERWLLRQRTSYFEAPELSPLGREKS